MPVVGLPTTLEVALDALLQQNHPTSWKITGEGDSTVVVIRLKPSPASDNMASEHAAVTPQYYRKKPPSHVNRDKRRAEERKTAVTRQEQDLKASEQNGFDNFPPLFAPTPPSHTVSHSDTALSQNNTPTQKCAREIWSESTDMTVLDTGTCSDQCNTDFLLPEDTTEHDGHESLERVRKAGYSVSVIQDYVSELTDRSLQRKLRDVSRNKDFCQVFTSEDSPDSVICESDDVVFQFDWSTTTDKPTTFFWFIKRDRKQMTREEQTIHSKMLLWTPTNRNTIDDRISAGLEVFRLIVDAIRFFLGDCACG